MMNNKFGFHMISRLDNMFVESRSEAHGKYVRLTRYYHEEFLVFDFGMLLKAFHLKEREREKERRHLHGVVVRNLGAIQVLGCLASRAKRRAISSVFRRNERASGRESVNKCAN